jgi:NADH dehydrogenase [ubiquinone] 1 alpha subcomplex assembly factor 7
MSSLPNESPLASELRRMILMEGPITVERYMGLCLGHPQYGYYMTRDPLGAAGDFTTAPEISQMFGELIGLWVAQCWIDMGQPNPVRLVECGPGRGTLMSDALRAVLAVPGLRQALFVDLIETSPVFKARQLRALSGCGFAVNWHADLATVPKGAPLIVLGNEFLDALPIRQYVRQDGQWHERLVGIEADHLVFGLARDCEPSIQHDAPQGSLLELNVIAAGFVKELAQRLKDEGGAALFLDYGNVKSGLGDTLQAIKQHAFVAPLSTPGEADITAHVDFDALIRVAQSVGLPHYGPLEQGAFLRALGLDVRAENLLGKAKDDSQRQAIFSAHKRLTDTTPTGMGRLFKAIAFAASGQPAPPAFAFANTEFGG